jgi:hypothetical protein
MRSEIRGIGDTSRMKHARTFKGSWFVSAVIAAVILAEGAAWVMAERFGLRSNPLVVAFLAVGVVAMIASVLFAGSDIE